MMESYSRATPRKPTHSSCIPAFGGNAGRMGKCFDLPFSSPSPSPTARGRWGRMWDSRTRLVSVPGLTLLNARPQAPAQFAMCQWKCRRLRLGVKRANCATDSSTRTGGFCRSAQSTEDDGAAIRISVQPVVRRQLSWSSSEETLSVLRGCRQGSLAGRLAGHR